MSAIFVSLVVGVVSTAVGTVLGLYIYDKFIR